MTTYQVDSNAIQDILDMLKNRIPEADIKECYGINTADIEYIRFKGSKALPALISVNKSVPNNNKKEGENMKAEKTVSQSVNVKSETVKTKKVRSKKTAEKPAIVPAPVKTEKPAKKNRVKKADNKPAVNVKANPVLDKDDFKQVSPLNTFGRFESFVKPGLADLDLSQLQDMAGVIAKHITDKTPVSDPVKVEKPKKTKVEKPAAKPGILSRLFSFFSKGSDKSEKKSRTKTRTNTAKRSNGTKRSSYDTDAIKAYWVKNPDAPYKEAASHFNCSPQTVFRVKKSM